MSRRYGCIFSKITNLSKISFYFGCTLIPERLRYLSYCDVLSSKHGICVNYYGVSKHKKFLNTNKLYSYKDSIVNGYYGNCGEDALFYIESERYTIAGIADGVGGWNRKGIDPSVFSGALVKFATLNTSQILGQNLLDNSNHVEPLKIMASAYDDLVENSPGAYGSSTACFAVFDSKTNILKIANLGDSGFLVRQNGSKYLQSVEQCHYFNCPYQLSLVPSTLKATSLSDRPSDALLYEYRLERNDFVILASDGVWDNFDINSSNAIKRISQEKILTKYNVNIFAEELFKEIIENGSWSKPRLRCSENIKGGFYGGKTDDITLIIFALVNDKSI